MIIAPRRHALIVALTATAGVVGTLAALYYYQLDLTLSHYDARGHLVVARRIFDSLTPGWRQIGAIWLPLPHLLNALPVQVDLFYRTGGSAVALSIAGYAAAVGAIGWIALHLTRSRAAAAVSAAVFALNPNVLYLQATPMTEPLLLGLLLPGLAMLTAWCGSGRPPAWAVGLVLGLACLTRYEAWPVAASAIPLAFLVRHATGVPWRRALRQAAPLALGPAVAVLGFMAFSRILTGEWFVSSGFFVPDNPARGRPLAALASVVWGLDQLTGRGLLICAGVGLVVAIVHAVMRDPRMLLPWSIAAAALLPTLAFASGHPYRIRYMVPLVAMVALGVGTLAGLARGRVALVVVAIVAALELRPLSSSAPMLVEAQWDRRDARGRAVVTACLEQSYDGTRILASMNSLGHYMQELGAIGIDLRDIVYEGNYTAWHEALAGPGPHIGWILISENPDGRDALIAPATRDATLLREFARVCEGGKVALYRRVRSPERVGR